MGEAKKRAEFVAKQLTPEQHAQYVAAAKERMANGRVGFSPDLGQALYAAGMQGTRCTIAGVRLTMMMAQDDGLEVNGVTWTQIDRGGEKKYAVTLVTQQTVDEIKSLMSRAKSDGVVFDGVLDSDTMTGDSGEVFRRIVGRVALLDDLR